MNIVTEATSITAYTPTMHAITGAFQPQGTQTWRLYITDLLATEHHRCHPVVCNQADALQWVTVIASLYEAAHPPTYHLNGADYSGAAAHLEDQP